jgi:hypothetical protein
MSLHATLQNLAIAANAILDPHNVTTKKSGLPNADLTHTNASAIKFGVKQRYFKSD